MYGDAGTLNKQQISRGCLAYYAIVDLMWRYGSHDDGIGIHIPRVSPRVSSRLQSTFNGSVPLCHCITRNPPSASQTLKIYLCTVVNQSRRNLYYLTNA